MILLPSVKFTAGNDRGNNGFRVKKGKHYEQATKRTPKNLVAFFVYLRILRWTLIKPQVCNLPGLGHLQLEIFGHFRAIAYPFLSVFVAHIRFLLESGPFCVEDFVTDVLDLP